MAIITDKFKRENIQLILDNFDSSANNYFIGIGRSEDWNATDTAPTVLNSDVESRRFRNSLQSVMRVADATFVVPRHNWTSNTVYSPYNDAQVGYPTQTYYVMNDNNQVYICVQQARNNDGTAKVSTVQPSGNTDGITFRTSDDYAWKFLYSISALDASKFMAANFLPVKLQGATDGNSQAADIEQLAVQNAAVRGQIVGYVLDSGGAGYSTTPTLTVVGDGSGAHVKATLTAQTVTLVEIDDSAGSADKPAFPLGKNYINATVTSTGGTPSKPAKIRPIFSSEGGLGNDPRQDLKASGVMFAVKPTGAQGSGDFIIGNDFRQVGLIKNPRVGADSDGGVAVLLDSSESTAIALRKMTFTGTPAADDAFTVDKTIVSDGSGGFKAVVDKVDGASLFFHQNDTTGYGTFGAGETITETDGDGEATTHGSTFLTAGEIHSSTGEVLYIDNRAAVTRSADQTEDIKIVIQI